MEPSILWKSENTKRIEDALSKIGKPSSSSIIGYSGLGYLAKEATCPHHAPYVWTGIGTIASATGGALGFDSVQKAGAYLAEFPKKTGEWIERSLTSGLEHVVESGSAEHLSHMSTESAGWMLLLGSTAYGVKKYVDRDQVGLETRGQKYGSTLHKYLGSKQTQDVYSDRKRIFANIGEEDG